MAGKLREVSGWACLREGVEEELKGRRVRDVGWAWLWADQGERFHLPLPTGAHFCTCANSRYPGHL